MITTNIIKLIMSIPIGILVFFLAQILIDKRIIIRYKILDRRPFNCLKCSSTWLFIFSLFSVFKNTQLIDYVVSIILSAIYFIIMIYIDNKNNNIKINNSKSDCNISKSVYINQNGDEKYKLVINIDNIEIVNIEFNSVIEREEYLVKY